MSAKKIIEANPLVSILMPVRNADIYLNECIDSILAQSYSNWELIAINDHSTDNSYLILKKYAQQDPRIKVIDLELGNGIIPALQLAYSLCDGDLITRMDADDCMSSDKLSFMSSTLLEAEEGHVAVGLVSYFRESGVSEGYANYAKWLNELTIHSSNYKEIYKECVIPSPCWMTWHSDFDRIGGFDSAVYPEDYDLCFRMKGGGLKVLPVNKVLHHWRDHDLRASRNDPNYLDNRFAELKVHYFLRQDRQLTRPLFLWGAGKKGKHIAKLLIASKVKFEWFTNNPQKIGHNIYGQILISDEQITNRKEKQIIIALSNLTEKEAAMAIFSETNLCLGIDYFPFC